MLGKLLKYDLKWIYKLLVIFYCLALVFAWIGRGLGSIENSTLFDVLSKIANGFAISMAVSAVINCVMRAWARFHINIYKDESYLTHTLPIPKNTIYFSKVLSAILCTLTTVIVAVICLAICYYSKENLEMIKTSLELAANTFDSTVVNLLLIISAVVFFEVLFILQIGYNGLIIGHRSNKGKMIKSIIIAFVMYMAVNGLSLAVIFAAGLLNNDIAYIITTNEFVNPEIIKIIMFLAIAMYFVYNVVFYFIGKWQLNKGVNVD